MKSSLFFVLSLLSFSVLADMPANNNMSPFLHPNQVIWESNEGIFAHNSVVSIPEKSCDGEVRINLSMNPDVAYNDGDVVRYWAERAANLPAFIIKIEDYHPVEATSGIKRQSSINEKAVEVDFYCVKIKIANVMTDSGL